MTHDYLISYSTYVSLLINLEGQTPPEAAALATEAYVRENGREPPPELVTEWLAPVQV